MIFSESVTETEFLFWRKKKWFLLPGSWFWPGFSGLVFRSQGNVPTIRSGLLLTEKNSELILFPRIRLSISGTPMSAKSKTEKLPWPKQPARIITVWNRRLWMNMAVLSSVFLIKLWSKEKILRRIQTRRVHRKSMRWRKYMNCLSSENTGVYQWHSGIWKDLFMKRKTAYLGLFSAVAIIFGYVESLIPVFAGIPGIKLGLANLAVLFILDRYSLREAALVSVVRILVIGFMCDWSNSSFNGYWSRFF